MMVYIVHESDLINRIFNFDVILFATGVNNEFGRGFSYELSVNFHRLRESENETPYGDLRKLGHIKLCNEDGITFCSCHIHKGGYRNGYTKTFLDYESLEGCLNEIYSMFRSKNLKIASPILGLSKFDGNGDRSKILNIFNKIFIDLDITLFDFEQEDYVTKIFRELAKLRSDRINGFISNDDYVKERIKIEWKRKNGIYKPISEDFSYKPSEKIREKKMKDAWKINK